MLLTICNMSVMVSMRDLDKRSAIKGGCYSLLGLLPNVFKVAGNEA